MDAPARSTSTSRESTLEFPNMPTAVIVQGPSNSLSNSESSNSQLTSSDKLSELPQSFAPSPRPARRSFEEAASSSAPDVRRLANAPAIRSSASEGSHGSLRGVETPTQGRGRVSFESDRTPVVGNSPRQAPLALNSEPALYIHSSSPLASSLKGRRTPHSEPAHSRAASRKESIDSAHSRATSPLRALMGRLPDLRRVVSREEPFVAVNPFRHGQQWHFHLPWGGGRTKVFGSSSTEDGISREDGHSQERAECGCVHVFHSRTVHDAHTFAFVVLPRIAYLHLLLRLPSLYFSRVARIFEDAEVSRPDIQRMIDICEHGESADAEVGGFGRAQGTNQSQSADRPPAYPDEWAPPFVTPALARFKHSWETFVDQLMREWKTLNLVSALLLSAILTLFQIPAAASDTLIRTPALLSLVCALMSLCYGCVYIVRFGTMRSMYRASRWAEEARARKTAVVWNAWVLLALPGVWLAWSMIAFCFAILAFVWRTGASEDPEDGSQRALDSRRMVGLRAAISAVFVIGVVYFWLVVLTFARYSRGGPRRRRAGAKRYGNEGERGRERERRGERSDREGRDEKEKEKGGERVEEREVGHTGRASGSTSPYVS